MFQSTNQKHVLSPGSAMGEDQAIQAALALDPAVQMLRPTSEAWCHGGLHRARPAVVVVAAPSANLGRKKLEKV